MIVFTWIGIIVVATWVALIVFWVRYLAAGWIRRAVSSWRIGREVAAARDVLADEEVRQWLS